VSNELTAAFLAPCVVVLGLLAIKLVRLERKIDAVGEKLGAKLDAINAGRPGPRM